MNWATQGPAWPNRELSRFIDLRPHRWHVQEAGTGPTLLLLHGAGGATHSWRGLLPILARRFHVVAPDLPGHGFTTLGTRQRSSLPLMAEDIRSLCVAEGWQPTAIVGHSAGAALALELAPGLEPRGVIGINAALGTFEGVAEWLFPMMAKLMAMNPLVPVLLTRMATERRIADLIASTGSEIDAEGLALYRRLIADRAHVEGTLAMMAQWDVEMLAERLAYIDLPVLFLTGDRDGTVPPRVSEDAARRMPRAEIRRYEGRGHLLHEETPEEVAQAISGFVTGLIAAADGASPRGHVLNQ